MRRSRYLIAAAMLAGAAALFWLVIFSQRYCVDWVGSGKQHLCHGLTVIEAGLA